MSKLKVRGRELGREAVFTISTAKPGNGVDQLRDDSLETYWQSDGSFPHYINIQFTRCVHPTALCIYLDYSMDESYTAKKIGVCAGYNTHELIDVSTIELSEPSGWVVIPLEDCIATQLMAGIQFIQVKILSMHQNGKEILHVTSHIFDFIHDTQGRDTHIRQIKIFGLENSTKSVASFGMEHFISPEMMQYSSIRWATNTIQYLTFTTTEVFTNSVIGIWFVYSRELR